jgi:hypothetical protein
MGFVGWRTGGDVGHRPNPLRGQGPGPMGAMALVRAGDWGPGPMGAMALVRLGG